MNGTTRRAKRVLPVLLILCLLLTAFPAIPAQSAGTVPEYILTVYVNQAKITLNGTAYSSLQPAKVQAGVTYAPLKTLAARYGYSVRYDAATKEAVAAGSGTEIRFKTGTSQYRLNGAVKPFTGKTYETKGVTMVPVRAWANATGSSLSASGSTVTLSWGQKKATADFRVTPGEIYATQTQVTYTSTSSNPDRILDERWEGNYPVFPEAGTYTVTHSVYDATGGWSAPYSVQVTVKPPNQPPTAYFETDKTEYKIGEPVQVTDMSGDDENAIAKTEWTGKQDAYFEPGEHTITLHVEDRHGLASDYSRIITVTDEVLFTEDEYNLMFTPVGKKFNIDGSTVLKMTDVPYQYADTERVLMISDSPERLTQPGILYSDSQEGNLSMFIYHESASQQKLRIYLAATNEGRTAETVTLGASGKAGPNPVGAYTGKVAAANYFKSRLTGTETKTVLQPGETKLVMPNIGSVALNYKDVLSIHADLHTTSPVRLTAFVVKDGDDPLKTLPTLSNLDRDGHVRGTFMGADRTFYVKQTLGAKADRILYGDNKRDPYMFGADMLTGRTENSGGNYGILYRATLQVKAHTMVAINARGGLFSGVTEVNGQVVPVTDESMLTNPNQVCVLYRTGDQDETVEITFMTGLGSNLPVNLLFLPMPDRDPAKVYP
ncbi:stalk domain-containing protein [Gorillibacterium sp. sgz500922]|uniref:stalk domain-containing protein n=1 Tax=Gorillibacterium sp. sgz500922 TaxID=3446694 RepID=UPI003F67542C